MKLGLHVPRFTWPGGAPRIREHLAAICRAADEIGSCRFAFGERGERVGETIEELRRFAGLGFTVEIMPAVADL
ncbi:MAG TPA: hypothetical protein VES42_08730 [Pilimelia sp.]|nr:hypothetical protein [Pilimelia sp.]